MTHHDGHDQDPRSVTAGRPEHEPFEFDQLVATALATGIDGGAEAAASAAAAGRPRDPGPGGAGGGGPEP